MSVALLASLGQSISDDRSFFRFLNGLSYLGAEIQALDDFGQTPRHYALKGRRGHSSGPLSNVAEKRPSPNEAGHEKVASMFPVVNNDIWKCLCVKRKADSRTPR